MIESIITTDASARSTLGSASRKELMLKKKLSRGGGDVALSVFFGSHCYEEGCDLLL